MENYKSESVSFESTNMENDKALAKKMQKIIETIDDKFKKKKAGMSDYIVIEDMLEEVVLNAASKSNLFISTTPNWIEQRPIEVVGKTYNAEGVVEFFILDTTTGHKWLFKKRAGGKGVDPGQAVGSAETYALRQWLLKTFSIGVKREEDKGSVWVMDEDGEPVKAVDEKTIKPFVQAIFELTKKPENIVEDVKYIIESYNNKYGTKFSQLKGEFPVSDFDKLTIFGMAALNAKYKKAESEK